MSPNITWALVDRDGTINEKASEGAYISAAASVKLVPGAGAALRRLTDGLRAIVVVTNQRGVARGLLTHGDVLAVNFRVSELVAKDGGRIDRFFVCPHDYGHCTCRKPAPGLLIAASDAFGLPLDHAVMIGDAETDVSAGNAVGACTIRLARPGTESNAAHVVPEISAAAELVLSGRWAGPL